MARAWRRRSSNPKRRSVTGDHHIHSRQQPGAIASQLLRVEGIRINLGRAIGPPPEVREGLASIGRVHYEAGVLRRMTRCHPDSRVWRELEALARMRVR